MLIICYTFAHARFKVCFEVGARMWYPCNGALISTQTTSGVLFCLVVWSSVHYIFHWNTAVIVIDPVLSEFFNATAVNKVSACHIL